MSGFLGGLAVKSQPANIGDTSSIPSSEIPHASEELSLCAQLLKPPPELHSKRSHCREKPAHHTEEEPHLSQLEKPWQQQ